MLKAFEARLRPGQTQEERCRAYPDPALEKQRLVMYTHLIKAVQALIEKTHVHPPPEPIQSKILAEIQNAERSVQKEDQPKEAPPLMVDNTTKINPSIVPELNK